MYKFLWDVESQTPDNQQVFMQTMNNSAFPQVPFGKIPELGRWLPENIAQPYPQKIDIGDYMNKVKPIPQLYGRNITRPAPKKEYVSLGNYNNLP